MKVERFIIYCCEGDKAYNTMRIVAEIDHIREEVEKLKVAGWDQVYCTEVVNV